MKREVIIADIECRARKLFGENAKVCTCLSEYPSVYVGYVNQYGECTQRITPSYKPKELMMLIIGAEWAKNGMAF